MAYIPALKYHFLTPIYDRFIRFWMPEEEIKNKVLSLAEIQEEELVLDFGCGTGMLMVLFQNRFPQAKILGLDVDKGILQIAENKGIDNDDLVLFDGGLIPFPNHHFDKVISTWVFQHLSTEQKMAAFREIKRVLKPSGTFIMGDWGRPANLLMHVLFFVLQVFDNFKTNADNLKGRIPALIGSAGFSQVLEKGHRNTYFGTLKYWLAKP